MFVYFILNISCFDTIFISRDGRALPSLFRARAPPGNNAAERGACDTTPGLTRNIGATNATG